MTNIIYTNENDCQDCYKCVRNCPVKAISIIDNHASIDDDRCIYCGTCVRVCPVEAQHFRNDEDKVNYLLSTEKRVILSLAPSFVGEFDISYKEIITQAKQAGFFGVSETALGAQLVTHFQQKLLKENTTAIFSTACPTFVQLVLKYYPELKHHLSPLLSPLLSHCIMLKELYGEDIEIVFAGPCIAKKAEADLHPELLNVAITFDEFKNILKTTNKSPKNEKYNEEEASFIPTHSNGGAIYPLDGGMVETIENLNPTSVCNSSFFNLSGIDSIAALLKSDNFNVNNLFGEFLACEGGCINGSGTIEKGLLISKKLKVANYYKSLPKYPEEDFVETYAPKSISTTYDFCPPVKPKEYTLEEKEKIWFKLGKYEKEDFIDCGGCGYDNCNNFAIACLDNRAEIEMCVTCMKKQAQNKMKTFMKATPLGLCVVDDHSKVVECNCKFLEITIDADVEINEEITQRAIGSEISRFFKIEDDIQSVMASKKQQTKIIHKDNKIFNLLLFPFDENHLVGMIVQDITSPTMKRDVVIAKAEEVIINNLKTVQKIAFLLGETAAETEITLNEIVDAYKSGGKDK